MFFCPASSGTRQSLISLNYSYFLSYIYNGIELWGNACNNYVYQIYIAHKIIIRLISGTNKLAHCAPFAANFNVLLFHDQNKYTLLCIMCNMFNGSSSKVMSNLFTKTCNVHCRYTRSVINN